jgi:predicted metal-dependent hydrolase
VRIEPEEQDFDPGELAGGGAERVLAEGVRLFNAGEYHAAHEAFEKLWLGNEAGDADFFKGLVQASIALHHFRRGELEGARKLYSGHRRLLAPFLPRHRGLDVAGFLAAMQAALQGVVRARPDERVPFVAEAPRLERAGAEG